MVDAVANPPALAFTGERFTPECVREIWYEHMHRYALAATHAGGRRVLDAACGEGYGSAMLAATASSVVGLDLSVEAIEHARRRYAGFANLQFAVADATALDHLPASSFDLVCSFETLEHVEAQEALIDGFARLLCDDGVLLVSTPDKRVYSDQSGFRNEFHVRELYRDEFAALLAARFPHCRFFGQKLLFQSVLWDAAAPPTAWSANTFGSAEAGLAYAPVYWIAACSRSAAALQSLPGLHLFGDAEESVYAHYYHEIRKNMAAGQRILELENELDVLRRRLAATTQQD